MGELLGDIVGWITDFVYSSGYVGLIVLIALGNLHLPVPTEITLALAGFLVGQGSFSFVAVMGWTTLAAVAVSLVFYYFGFWVGEENLRRLVGRIERFKLLRVSDLDKAGGMFERHGGKAIFIGHLVPGMGALISIPAGIKHMPIWGRFAFYTIVGSTVWNAGFVILGWVLGSNWTLVEQYASLVHYAVLAVVAAGVLWFVWRRLKTRE